MIRRDVMIRDVKKRGSLTTPFHVTQHHVTGYHVTPHHVTE